MKLYDVFLTYIYYLIHPFKTHEQFVNPDVEKPLLKLTAYESLSTSWVFVIINGIARIALLNLVLVMISNMIADSNLELLGLVNIDEMSNYSFLILSAVLDIIFFPLFGLFIIQYWEIVIKFFGKLIQTPGDLAGKANEIISVYYASHIFKIIPFFGAFAQSISSIVLMYAGLRVQLKASPALCFCIIFSPVFIGIALISVFMLLMLVFSAVTF
ncbi:MAG: hypothetical protein CME62_17585 [Halobacteriovoraceae bacterium]|nr:hypothetical protein [Halobacteriovoraceae bacterium]|tara:strand:+ start:27401 stop:28042 length:642 start_codon:yes stop_codon:yes gene_type:complete